ncbi:DUF4199 domain-containing protein [Roseivirga echinicomitans]|uniref:DUF4199 domain-containing protein n=1 Tax=Roseivirga echinicomitans TaxID=296218 RepID=A0A150XD52_9BACT|nr:DUF4199 domain-containing protein [Roseivirga echinicomitans]KYG76655.1 hypothetical protein AWN68_06410 [Roseivirga echinicomitans]
MEEQVTGRQIGIKYGVIFGLISALYTLAMAMARIQLPFVGMFIQWAIVIGVFVFACKEYKANNGNIMSFGKGFGIIMVASLIGGLIRSVASYVYFIVDPAYLDFMKEAQQNSPFGPPPDQGNAANVEGMMAFFTSPEFIAIMSFLMAIFAGLIFGLIVSAIMKNEEDEF